LTELSVHVRVQATDSRLTVWLRKGGATTVDNVADGGTAGELEIPYTVHELRAYQRGTAAMIMPVREGWKIAYLSGENFERERSTTFPTIEEALAAIADLLPVANSDEEKAKARDMEEILWLQLQQKVRGDQDQADP
jgi:hypothetical protein